MLQRRSRCDHPPALASDGGGGHREAFVEVYGRVPPYQGRGRPPSRKGPQSGWQSLQVVKQRANGRVVGIQTRVRDGEPQAVLAVLGEHLAYVERTHLTSRHMNGRLVRKTLGFSKKLAMLQAACIWEDVVYNFARPIKTLRVEVRQGDRRWQYRSAGMVAGLTDHIWSLEELLTHVPVPINDS